MDINEVIVAKDQVRRKVRAAINKFETETGLRISSVDAGHSIIFQKVDVEVRIDIPFSDGIVVLPEKER